jgi:hypothetical protein
MAKVQVPRLVLPDPEARIYASRVRLTTEPMEMGLANQTEDVGPVLSALLEIPGVSMVQVFAYHVMVCKCPAYTWDEIEVSVLRLFAALNLDLETLKEVE